MLRTYTICVIIFLGKTLLFAQFDLGLHYIRLVPGYCFLFSILIDFCNVRHGMGFLKMHSGEQVTRWVAAILVTIFSPYYSLIFGDLESSHMMSYRKVLTRLHCTVAVV